MKRRTNGHAALYMKMRTNHCVLGIAGAIIFLILLVLLVWMICVRATRPKKQEKVGLGPGAEMAHGPNFYYGGPAPYAESIAPSHHSNYAHYYDDEEDGWDMPNFYNNEGFVKDGGMSAKMNSLARSNASLYGNKEELYDRLRRHAYQGGKKGTFELKSRIMKLITFLFADKSSAETTSDSDDGRHA